MIGELQAITYHVQREKAPVYTMGSAEPRSFSRGKRGIAGTLVFTIFDRDALLEALKADSASNSNFYRIGGTDGQLYESTPDDGERLKPLTITEWDSALTDIAMSGVSGAASENAGRVTQQILQKANPYYADEIPPFDITISFANEYGQMARVVLYAVEILNEGSGFSIDNVTSEKACTFVARRVDYLRAVDQNGKLTSNPSTTRENPY